MSPKGYSLLLLLLLALLRGFAVGRVIGDASRRVETKANCGYQTCPAVQPGKLNIHLVAHTHDDVGWLKTVDQYYFGSRSMIQKAGVQYILDSVVRALRANPERRFIYVETAFFWKWWLRQNDEIREAVTTLIDEGRLEIVGGAWSMNDEATTHYHSIVDQFTWGFRRLNDTFGECARPRVGWQIDPFGHSREQASLFAQMAFDGMLFGRIDYQDKAKRLEEKSMEFVWKASDSLGKRAELFTGAMFNTYSPPPGFCFDVLCADEPIIDDPEIPDYNVDVKIDTFVKYAVEQARRFRTNNIILTMGGDFTYQQAEMYYANLDKLIRYTNERNGSTVNAFYSTPSCYLKSLHDAQISWPTKSDDFFPYASDPHSYWTGYFTSRPSVKIFERMGNNLLQVSKQLVAFTDLKGYEKELEHFREAMGIMQHHDAVTGTEKQHVASDYSRILYESIHQAEAIVAKALRKWNTKGRVEETAVNCESHFCLELNISSCAYTEENNKFLVKAYNPLSRPVSSYIRLPVSAGTFAVHDHKGNSEVVAQLVPIHPAVFDIPGRKSSATNELVFRAEIPALGYNVYTVTKTSNEIAKDSRPSTHATSIGGEFYDISVNEEGRIVVNYKKERDMSFTQSFHYYEGAEGDNREFKNRSSGAYIFRPKEAKLHDFAYTGSYQIVQGPVVEEIHQKINEWVSQVVRVYQGEEYIEFDWLVGPIPVEDKIGKEIVTKYSSNLNTGGEFYTDSNGREMLKRKRNYRPTWNLRLNESISGNYYPVTTKISLKDGKEPLKLSALIDRAQGGSSMKDGEIELMLHRRLLKDDAFGVSEALNETAFGKGLVVRGSHYLFGGRADNLDEFAAKEKNLALQLTLRPSLSISPNADNIDGSSESCGIDEIENNSGLTTALPQNVHILTLEPWKDDTLLLRLEHIFEVGEATKLSEPVQVNIKDIFSAFTIESIEETTLGGNQWIKDVSQLKWEKETNEVPNVPEDEPRDAISIRDDRIDVLLKPMEIRTFIVKVSARRF